MTINFWRMEYEPVKFHPYTSRTKKRIFQIEYGNDPEMRIFQENLVQLFNHAGVKAWIDNKIVFECSANGQRIFFGFYDGVFTIGLDYYDENER